MMVSCKVFVFKCHPLLIIAKITIDFVVELL
jgi:hypothetical protein